MIESFFSIVKECFYPNRFANVAKLEVALYEYIRIITNYGNPH
ncbi:IS3 family transposase [Avibacterium paragallinarum]|nr:IS3 family transposase [Avibacterium paragallinarum]